MVSIPLGTINTSFDSRGGIGIQVSIPLGTINTPTKSINWLLNSAVSIPLGTINTC